MRARKHLAGHAVGVAPGIHERRRESDGPNISKECIIFLEYLRNLSQELKQVPSSLD
jgi:hypothetical protein